MRDLLEYRAEFPILEHTTYLVSHSLGAMPRRAAERLAEYARMWAERGIRSWAEGWWATPWTVGDQVGRIVGAPPGSTVMHQNVAIAEAVALSCFRPVDPGRNRVVYERGNFPSVRYLYQAQSELEVVVCEDDGEILERIDERTLLVPMSHVLFKAAEIQDVEPIVRRAHEVGAHVILDCYQSAGIVPLDVGALGVDFAVGGSVKWLCGGPGNAWLYVRPDLVETLEPTFTGWQAHARPFAFEEDLEYASGAARFLTGTPNPAAHYAATAGYDLVEEIGVARIRGHSLRQTQLLLDLADEAGFEVTSPREAARRGGTVVVVVPEFAAVHAELEARGILCDFRPDAGIRLGPHFYTSDDEIRFAIGQIVDILESGAHRQHAGAVALH
jgi:kynureninase